MRLIPLDMSDRFARSFVVSLVAAMIMVGINLVSYNLLHFSDKRYYNFAAVMIYGRLAKGPWESIFAQAGQIFFSIALGIVFAYLLLFINHKNYLFKGWFWGVISWFSIYAITVIFAVPELANLKFSTAVSNFLSSSLWGISLAWLLHWADKKIEARAKTVKLARHPAFLYSPAPALKPELEKQTPKFKKPKKIEELTSDK